MNLEPHALAEMFPPMDADRLQELAADIRVNGQLLPIILLDGKILDGRSRYIAARMAGREPVTEEFNANEVNRNPVEFVMSMNMHRRDLTPSQRAAIAADLAEQMRYKTGPRDQWYNVGQKLGNGEADEPENLPQMPRRSRKDAAKQARVSTGYVAEATALKHEDPEAFEQVKAGTKTLRQATRSKRQGDRHDLAREEALARIEKCLGYAAPLTAAISIYGQDNSFNSASRHPRP